MTTPENQQENSEDEPETKRDEDTPSKIKIPTDTEGNPVRIIDYDSRDACLKKIQETKQKTEDDWKTANPNANKKKTQQAMSDIQKRYETCIKQVNELYSEAEEAAEYV